MTAGRPRTGLTMAAPGFQRPTLEALRQDPAIRRIVRDHRRLTRACAEAARDPQRSTVVACSGGADSLALLLALAVTPIPIVAAHVIHDIRAERESLADRDHVRSIAAILAVPFCEASVSARTPGNLERNARRAREAALARIARDQRARFIATGHHADDVLETMLMRLARGAGPRGLAGPHPTRRLGSEPNDAWIVRPMLGVSRIDTERICSIAGVEWRHDTTNDDTALLRNAIRAQVVPHLKAMAPGVERRAARAAELLRGASEVLTERAGAIDAPAGIDGSIRIERSRLRDEPPVVGGEAIRLALARVGRGVGLDRVGAASIDRVLHAARDRTGGVRTFRIGRAVVELRRETLVISPARS